MGIQRYNISEPSRYHSQCMSPRDGGAYVLYADHVAAMPRWRAASEAPGKDGLKLLLYGHGRSGDQIGPFTGSWFNDGHGFDHNEYRVTVTHWQPLPPAPNKDEI